MPSWDQKKKPDVPFDFDKIERLMEELVNSLIENQNLPEGHKPSFIGFSINFDSSGKPKFGQPPFGKPRHAKRQKKHAHRPLTDVINEGKTITIAIELRNASEKSIHVSRPDEHTVKITAGPKHRLFRKEMFFEERLMPVFKAKFNNGILEIVLEKNSGA